MRKIILILLLMLATLASAQEIRRPTAEADDTTASLCGGNQDISTPMPSFYDSSGDSTSSTLADWTDGNGVYMQRKFTGFAAGSGSYAVLSLKVTSHCVVVANFNSVQCVAQYSLNGGSTWTTIFDSGSARAKTTDSITLSPTQDMSKLQVRACIAAAGVNDGNYSEVDLYGFDIRTEGTLAGGTNNKFRLTTEE